MANGYAKEIQNRIGAAPDGTIFIVSDFADVADSETIRRNLNRLVQAGTLRRILKGVFEKPKYSKLLGEYVAADPDAVAKALARCYHWTIAPCGETALNMLGLSTQVTAVWSYISDGPYKTYEWDKTKIEFKHRTNKEVTGLSPMTILVIQALKTLGKEHVDEKTIRVLSRRLNEDEKATILHHEANRPEHLSMPQRYSRHYYDLYCMAKSPVKEKAFERLDLLQKVVDFKMKFYPRAWARYPEAVPATLKLLPPSYRLGALQEDYSAMRNMLYGEIPSFETMMEAVGELEKEINAL